MDKKPLNVLVVDDSTVARELLIHILEADPGIRVVGAVPDGQAALDFVKKDPPDLVLMDIHMPGLNGFDATRQIMESRPVPIVICSATTNPKEVATTFRLMEAGALACVQKPSGPTHPEYSAQVMELCQTVKLMAEVKVVRRWSSSRLTPRPVLAAAAERQPDVAGLRAIGIGASTGGPPVLQTVLASLTKDFSAPILVVQHIAHGFLPGLVEWLNETTGMKVQTASHGTNPLPGNVYFAPDDLHMGLASNGRLFLTREPMENGLRPAVSYLFRSLAESCGGRAIGVLLTGMGKDGAAELKLMKDAGAVTIAQDRNTSVVHGMPGEAIKLGGATHVLPAERIAGTVMRIIKEQQFREGGAR